MGSCDFASSALAGKQVAGISSSIYCCDSSLRKPTPFVWPAASFASGSAVSVASFSRLVRASVLHTGVFISPYVM